MPSESGTSNDKTLTERASAVADRIESALNLMLAAMLGVLVVCLCYQVFGRYVLDDAPGWTEELARFLVVYVTMIGTAIVMRNHGHITVNVLVSALPERIRVCVFGVRDAAILGSAGILIWYGYGLAEIGGNRLSPALEISMYWPFIVIPISGMLLAYFLFISRLERNRPGATDEEVI